MPHRKHVSNRLPTSQTAQLHADDEPCSALDPLSSKVVEQLILRLAKRITIIVVTHNLAQARRIADDVAFFWVVDGRGTLIEQGPTERNFESSRDPRTAAYVR